MNDQTITISKQQLTLAFAHWERQYRDHPEYFQSEASKLKKEQPETYGEKCAEIIFDILVKIRIVDLGNALEAQPAEGATPAEVAAAPTP